MQLLNVCNCVITVAAAPGPELGRGSEGLSEAPLGETPTAARSFSLLKLLMLR